MPTVLSATSESSPESHPLPPTFRLGIAGPPGAGKSTFIEALGMSLVGKGHRVAVLAIGVCAPSMLCWCLGGAV